MVGGALTVATLYLVLLLVPGSTAFHLSLPVERSKLASSTTAMSSSSSSAVETSPMTVMEGIRQVAEDHDVFLLDMWGVMHDGTNTYEGVLETVQQLKKSGKEMIILSNSSKRIDKSIQMLKKLGFDPSDFSQIITSGDVRAPQKEKNGVVVSV